MTDINALNQRRIQLQQRLYHMGMMNTPSDPVAQLQADAQYRLVRDAWIKAEREYTDAIENMTVEELEALVNSPKENAIKSLD